MKRIYFDNASSTKLDPEVFHTYTKLLQQHYVNSDALYDEAVTLFRLQEEARKNIANLLGVHSQEIIFTSGASEGNNVAIKGVAFAHPTKRHLITSIYEHSSVYEAFRQLERLGWEVTYLYPNSEGKITPESVKEALREDTILVSIMSINNELGSINDLDAIKKIIKKESQAYFHCDMTQSIAKMDFSLEDIDLMSFSAHKIHGLKGSGILMKKKHVPIEPLISGGQQEFALRGGTSNAATNIALAKTLRLALQKEEAFRKHVSALMEKCKTELAKCEGVVINSPKDGIYNLLNLSTPLTSEVLMNALNAKGIMVSSRSTCGSRKSEPSRVLSSMNINDRHAIRISFDLETTEEDVDFFIATLKESIAKYG